MATIPVTPSVVQDLMESADERDVSFVRQVLENLFPQIIERFWNTVQRCPHGTDCADCCWLWRGAHSKGGYGAFVIPGMNPRIIRANRFAWVVTRGLIPEGLFVLHNCPQGDDPRCVNPQHLWLGNQRANMADARHKDRLSTGERHYSHTRPESRTRGASIANARLNDEQVLDIRYLYAQGMRQQLLATIYEVSFQTISRVVRGNGWKHLPLVVEVR